MRPLLRTSILALAIVVSAIPAWAADNVLRLGTVETVGSLDPQVNFLVSDLKILSDMYEGLVTYDAAANIVPGAAEKWDISTDGLTYTFHLRDGLKWSNGDALTAQEFVDGMIRVIAPDTGSDKAYIFNSVLKVKGADEFIQKKSSDPGTVGFKAPDSRTVVIELASPAPYALEVLIGAYSAPLHGPSWKAFGKDFIKPGNVVSNGAYMLAENVPQSHVKLVKNPNYWGASSVKINEVSYVVTEDQNTAVKLFDAGQLDSTADIPTAQLELLQGKLGDQVRIDPSTETDFFDFNLAKAPFDNVKLRMALSMAIDRKILAEKVLKGGTIPSYGYVITIPGYAAPRIAEAAMSDPDRVEMAKKLYAEAGFGPDNPLSLTIETSNREDAKKMSETIAVMWKQALGVNAKVNAQDRAAWLNAFSAGGWDVYYDNYVGDFAGPESYLTYLDPRTGNGYPWKSPSYETSIDTAMALNDKSARWSELSKAEKILLDDYPIAPAVLVPNRHLVAKRVKGWIANPVDWHMTQYLSVED